MKRCSLILALALGAGASSRAEIPAGWGTNVTATLAAATSAHQPTLVYFTASWCGPCKLVSSITLSDPLIRDALTNAACVAVDIDEQPALAAKYQISAVPTFLLLAAEDGEVARVTGFQPIGDFLPWLTQGIAATQQALRQQALAEKTLAEVDQLLAATGTQAARQAAMKLFGLGGERGSGLTPAVAVRLGRIADRDPAALLAGLNDPQLATRIQVANALRDKLGDKFDLDPWADAQTRRQQVRAGQAALNPPPEP